LKLIDGAFPVPGCPPDSLRATSVLGCPPDSVRATSVLGCPPDSLRVTSVLGCPPDSLRAEVVQYAVRRELLSPSFSLFHS